MLELTFIFAVSLISLLIGVFIGCVGKISKREDDCQLSSDAYLSGREAGRAEGYNQGYKDGANFQKSLKG